jgi:serine/threonine protein kinase/Tol biopolymer transport system component
MAALSPGAKLGRYEIVSPLGAGGMGEVYLAQDTTLDRKVALKVLPENVASDRSRMQRFVQEAKAASALNHPNIITIHEIGTEPGAHFMVTEFIEGENLRHHLRKPMTLLEAIDIAVQVASALATAHAAGIIHRDIKPENMMLRQDGIVKVLDFGLAKLTERWRKDDVDRDAATQAFVHTEPGSVVGTTAYLSPEQARALEVDPRTDIWSLGVVLYEMITGRGPFKGETPSDTSAAILTAEPPPLAEYVPDIPAEIERIVRKALQKKRDERYQTVKDMLLDLKSLRRELDVSAAIQRSGTPSYTSGLTRPAISTGPPPLTNQTSLLTKQYGLNRKAQLGAGGLLLLIVAGVGWYWWRHRDADVNRIGALTVTQLVGRKNGLGETGARHARFSPDGKFIAYASPKGNGVAIWLKQLGTGEPFANQGEMPAASSPIWSPDGLQIAFLSKGESQNGIWTMAAFGGSPTLLKSLDGYTRELIAWTKTGKIYFVRNGNLYSLNIATQDISSPITLTSAAGDREFAISPNEDRIAFTDLVNGQSDLWVAPLSGSAPTRVTNDSAPDSNPVWTSDGKAIVYSSKRNGISQICLVRLDGRQPAQLTVNDSNTNVLDVSSDGTKILYSTDRDESDIWSVTLERAKETQLTSDSGLELWPDAAPDNQTVAYQANRALTTATFVNSQLMAKSLSSGTLDIQLAADGFAPLWSPDGKHAAFLRYANKTMDLWVVHATGGDAKQVTQGGVIFGGFAQLPYNRVQTQDFQWSPDSSRLIYCADVSGVTNVWQVGTDATRPIQLSENKDAGSRLFNPSWAPDGQRAAWLAYEPAQKIWSIWVLDGRPRQIFGSEAVLGIVGWTANGAELVVKEIATKGKTLANPADVNLSVISIRDGKQRAIGTLKATYFQNIKLAPAKDQIAYVSRPDDADTLLVMPLTGGAAKNLLTSSDSRVYLAAIAWSPDGKTIYFGKQASWTLFSMIDNFK